MEGLLDALRGRTLATGCGLLRKATSLATTVRATALAALLAAAMSMRIV